jgi:peptidoglycan hydrolase-like protein with peptidoglycan-binding domain
MILSLALGVLAPLAGGQSAQAQTALREDVFDIQTALHYYGFMAGPVDGEVGPDTERGLRALGSYLGLGAIDAAVMELDPLPFPLRTLMDAYVGRNRVDAMRLDERDQARLAREGERFWIRKQLQPRRATWGVDVARENDTCGAWANEQLIGTEIDQDNVPTLEGAGTVRVLYFGPATTDFRPDRLNVSVDPWSTVTNLTCG